MSDKRVSQAISSALRQQAEQQLHTGAAGLSIAYTASGDALGALYRLSSAADTASDGLKLLHELQTYQVELEIQLEQLQLDENQHRVELTCYRQFFHLATQPCLLTDANGVITDANAAAAQRLSTEIHNLSGRTLLSLFDCSCQPLLSASLAKAMRNQHSTTLMLSLHYTAAMTPPGPTDHRGATTVQLTIQPGLEHNALLILLT